MVATRSTTDTTDPNTIVMPNSVEAGLERIHTAIDLINQNINGLLLFQQMAAPIVTKMANGEGTSQMGGQPTYGRLTKHEFPKFSGGDVQGWLFRVNQFFLIDGIHDDAQKLMLASMHLFGNALNSHKQFLRRSGDNVTWQRYEEGIKERFDPVNEDPMVELKNLKQVGSVHAYQDLFEALLYKQAGRCLLFGQNARATLAIPMSSYTPLLSTPKNVMTPFVPKSGGNGAKGNTLPLPAIPQTIGLSRPRKQLTQQEMTEKRAKHLCFYCDQRYSHGHKCSGQMYYLEVIGCDEIIEDEDGVISEQEPVIVSEVEEDTMPQVSLNAMNGVNNYQTMRVKGHIGKQVLHILVDCGSTHNFLDLQPAKRLGCRMSKICPLQVSVANGHVMSSVYECKNFKWSLQGQVYETDVMILPLGGCEMVLEIQWLATLGKIQCDFKNLVIEIVVKGQRCILRGTTQSALKWMQGRHVSSSLSQIGTEISSMAIFDEPKGLPPNRSHDHTIPLTPNAPPINIRPYRHPPMQKDVIELMVKELLEVRTIRNSHSSFSSPIKKKDGTWRMCVDYKQLNKYIIKDKFPILVIEELLDELSGAKVFLKLDLRSGYHHIRMKEADIHKTAFRTHEGHYEFMVMPFGLTNAPSIFQSLMNDVFRPYLRKFVLLLFDDILIYNNNEEDHWKHLHIVEYLGHIISGERVSTDPSKIQAMEHKEAQTAFLTLKEAMTQTPVLALPDYNKTFVVETDASGEKEFLAVLMALEKWISYLLDRHFKIKTDHFILKYLLNQRLTTPFQVKWLPKLLGFDYEFSYNKGSENVVADALSRLTSRGKLNSLILSTITSDLLQKVKESYANDPTLQEVIQKLTNGTQTGNKYVWEDNVLKRKRKITMGADEQLRTTIVQHYHTDAMGGHLSINVTAHKVGTCSSFALDRGGKKVKDEIRSLETRLNYVSDQDI
ncbi:putative mitochondrial protein [Tanacetum coccineum]